MAIINANEYDDIVKLILTKNFEIIFLKLSLSLSDWHYKGRLQILLYWLGFSTQVLKLKRHFLSTSNSKRGNWDYVSTIKLRVPRKCLFKCWVNIPVPSFGNIQVPSFGQPIKCLKKSCQPISFFVWKKCIKNSSSLYQWRLVVARV